MSSIPLEFPNEPVALGDTFYVERPPIEQQVYQEIIRPGCLLRIKAPSKMGKSSLLLRILDYAKCQNYHTIYLDFQKAEVEIFNSLDKFLRWFCANIAHQLQLPSNLAEYWDEELGCKTSCSIYLQDYLLQAIDSPLVLALNEVNCLFEYPKIAKDFLALLRAWHEEAKHNEILQKLRVVICHSTEIYLTLNINQSPFNVGLAIRLPELTTEQIQHLAKLHGLDCLRETSQVKSLEKMLGGHPYLIRIALYELAKKPEISLEKFFNLAPTITGSFRDHLRNLLATIQNNPTLGIALKKAIAHAEGVELDHIHAYKLESMGLVKLQGNRCKISCELYHQYFASQNLDKDLTLQAQLLQLKQENLELQQLATTDSITKLPNRLYFDIYLEQTWQALADDAEPLSLIVCRIDYFKIYSEVNGKPDGINCLQQVAEALNSYVKRLENLKSKSIIVARYEKEEFALVLPKTNILTAAQIGDELRQEVKKLAIVHSPKYAGLPAFITISVGVSGTIPNAQKSVSILVDAASEALDKSKKYGGDFTSVSATLNCGLGNR